MHSQQNNITKVIIAGGGTAGWMTAAAMSKLLGKSIDITLVESDQIATIGVGEATIPPIRTFHRLLGIDEQAFMRATQATFKLGIQFENWRNVDDAYIHSFGVTGKECWAGEFHHFWLKAKQLGIAAPFGDYCYELKAAQANKFGFSEQQPMNFAYHLDATRYAKFLRDFSEKNGVTRVEGIIKNASKVPESGYIKQITLDDGRCLKGDFYIDCTGFKGLLIEQTLHSGYEDWSHWMLCDSAVAMQTKSVEKPRPYTRSVAHDAGWRWQIPLQNRVGNGLVYSSQYLSKQDAEQRLRQSVSGEPINEPNHIRFRPGKRKQPWKKNCVAIGLSSGFIEPLESTSIHLIMTAIVRLMRLFPFDGITDSAVNEYNTKFGCEMDCILDFITLHYKVTERQDSDFWRHCKAMDTPQSLTHKIQLFAQTGRVFLDEFDIFRVDSWTQVMLGQGLIPEQFHRIVDQMDTPELSRFMQTIKQQVDARLDKLPSHSDFLTNYLAIN